jgi:hypothetical protein
MIHQPELIIGKGLYDGAGTTGQKSAAPRQRFPA